MRIAIDMQGAQSDGSRTRGIGRYTRSLVRALLLTRPEYEFILVLNGAFPDAAEEIIEKYSEFLSRENFRVWFPLTPCHMIDPDLDWQRNASEIVREAFIESLEPDFIIVTSMFEGLTDSSVTSINAKNRSVPTAVILYDLIPYLYPEMYLTNPDVEKWYNEKLKHLLRGDLLLSISEASRKDCVESLNRHKNSVVNILGSHDPEFQPITVGSDSKNKLYERYGIQSNFIMYTGGIDHRKNIKRLIKAYSKLTDEMITEYQLCIICSINEDDKKQLKKLAKSLGLPEHSLILTGYIPENDLISLYNLCSLYVFPSWYEGFGLPLLEAMACGAPALTSNISSLPEVAGREDMLFDPFDEEDIANKITYVLENNDIRDELKRYSLQRSKMFSWKASAEVAINAIEGMLIELGKKEASRKKTLKKKLAFISPLPPDQSGIANYSFELLEGLGKIYNIDVVVPNEKSLVAVSQSNYNVISIDAFTKSIGMYDRVLYQIGNSDFHSHMFQLLKAYPGVVALHDFVLSGILSHLEFTQDEKMYWCHEIYKSHGYSGLLSRFSDEKIWEAQKTLPANLSVLNDSLGLILHSRFSASLIEKWYGNKFDEHVEIINLAKKIAKNQLSKNRARKILGLKKDQNVIVSFGTISSTKKHDVVLQAWEALLPELRDTTLLAFVGGSDGSDFSKNILEKINGYSGGGEVVSTGYVSPSIYQAWLSAADLSIQLREGAGGESSGPVYDCFGAGLPLICSFHGSMTEHSDDFLEFLLPNENYQVLSEKIVDGLNNELYQERALRAKEYTTSFLNPKITASKYSKAIESFYDKNSYYLNTIRDIGDLEYREKSPDFIANAARSLSTSFPCKFGLKQLFVDISGIWDCSNDYKKELVSKIVDLMRFPPEHCRVELVDIRGGHLIYARKLACSLLSIPDFGLEDGPVDIRLGDKYFYNKETPSMELEVFKKLRLLNTSILSVEDILS